MPVTIQIIIILLLMLVNGFFALAELAVVSARKVRLARMANQGDRRARQALALAESPGHFLASVQIGITLVGILAGAFGEATLSIWLGEVLSGVPWLAPYSGTLSFLLVVLIITYLSLILGELAPKRIALSSPERWARLVAGPMQVVSVVAAPAIRFFNASSALLVRLLGLGARPTPPVSDEEISMLFEEGISAGVFEPAEKEIVDRLFRMSDRRVNQIMTPRTEIAWLDVNAAPEEIARVIAERSFTAYLVCDGNLDRVVGVAFSREMLQRLLAGEPIVLRELAHPAFFLPESFHALRAIDRLKARETHMAVILDEFGATEGIVTFTDLFESLVGEIAPKEESEVTRRPDGSLLVDGLLATDELKTLLDLPTLPGEEEGEFRTLAGFLLTLFGRVPEAGDAVTWDHYRFEIMDMDAFRIDRVLITRLPGEAGQGG